MFMVRDTADASLKRQVNMAIGIRTLYSLCSYCVRHGFTSPMIRHSQEGYARGQVLWYTLMWGAVMWHWRHQTGIEPGEMDKGQVNQMDFIYNQGDSPGLHKWTENRYLAWFVAVLFAKFVVPKLTGLGQAASDLKAVSDITDSGPLHDDWTPLDDETMHPPLDEDEALDAEPELVMVDPDE